GALSLADVRGAADRIAPYVLKTPTLSGESLVGPDVWLKAENLQRTGSFKVRGAVNAVLQLTPEQRHRGVITLSAGNHGQALAYAAQAFQIPCVVVIREDAQLTKLQALRRYGREREPGRRASGRAFSSGLDRRRAGGTLHPCLQP